MNYELQSKLLISKIIGVLLFSLIGMMATNFWIEYHLKSGIANSMTYAIREDIIFDNLRKVRDSLGNARSEFDQVTFRKANSLESFSLFNPIQLFVPVKVSIDIFSDTEKKHLFGVFDFYYSPLTNIWFPLILWTIFAFISIPFFKKNRDLLLKAHAEALILEKDRSTAELARHVAHDIRSPLSVLNMIVRALPDPNDEKRNLIQAVATRINEIADDLLKTNRTNPSQTISVDTIIHQIVTEKRILLTGKKDILIDTNIELLKNVFCSMQTNDLARILSNLLNNAIESLKNDSGSIKINGCIEGKFIKICLNDTGVGIPKHVLERLGSLGFTFGRKPKTSGSGLGIYHARKTTESVGGKLGILSRERTGTSVILELPILT